MKRPAYIRPVGNADSKIFFLLDKPARIDAETGRLLSGPQTVVLESMLSSVGLEKDDVWVSVASLCAPEEDKSPKISEVKACRARLEEELHIIQPQIIVGLGNLALKALVPARPPALADSLGRVLDITIPGDHTSYVIPAMITYSLSHLLRNQDTAPGGLWYRFFTHIDRANTIANQLSDLEENKCQIYSNNTE